MQTARLLTLMTALALPSMHAVAGEDLIEVHLASLEWPPYTGSHLKQGGIPVIMCGGPSKKQGIDSISTICRGPGP